MIKSIVSLSKFYSIEKVFLMLEAKTQAYVSRHEYDPKTKVFFNYKTDNFVIQIVMNFIEDW